MTGLWSQGMRATLSVQFLSSLGDNALLFAALALVRRDQFPAWSGVLLQAFFVTAYILLAPFVGLLADAWPKGRVMILANLVKVAGALCMCLNVNPFLGYALVGCGAAAYSPAKYGILGELTVPKHLVEANSFIEGSTVAGILLGAIVGGVLTDWSIDGALATITACYAAAASIAVRIPRIKQTVAKMSVSVIKSVKMFAGQTRALLKNPRPRMALTGTALFWGAGAALRFLVIAWVPVALKVTNNRLPAFLTAMVAAGIVIGAALAGKFVRLEVVHRVFLAGILIGAGVCLLSFVHTLTLAFALMALVGICSGFFVVPLDALLQNQGEAGVGVGSAIAIQNLFENLSMLALVSGYAIVSFIGVPVHDVAIGFGLVLSLSMGALAVMSINTAKVSRHT